MPAFKGLFIQFSFHKIFQEIQGFQPSQHRNVARVLFFKKLMFVLSKTQVFKGQFKNHTTIIFT